MMLSDLALLLSLPFGGLFLPREADYLVSKATGVFRVARLFKVGAPKMAHTHMTATV